MGRISLAREWKFECLLLYSVVWLLVQVQPTEIYNLAAQSHVKVSFDLSEYTANVDGVGTLRMLDAIRTCGLGDTVRFYQVSYSFPRKRKGGS